MEPEKQGDRRRRQPKKQTRDREVGGRLGARPKEVCVQSSDTMQDSTQGLRAVPATRRCVCRGVCVQRSVCAEERHNARQRSGPEGSDGHESFPFCNWEVPGVSGRHGSDGQGPGI